MKIEIDCRKCKNCTGNSCKIYGDNADVAVKECANDGFKNYKELEETRKIIIDIKKRNYKSVMNTLNRPIGQRLPYGLSDTFKNGTILPDNPTNGDMIKAIFPKGTNIFNNEWWNAPYYE